MMDKRGKSKISVILTILVVAVYLIPNFANAVEVKISVEKDKVKIGKKVEFDVKFKVQDGERVPFQNLTLHIKNGSGDVKTCTFNVNGTKISGCDNLKIKLKDKRKRGDFGYGYNFGNGFGFDGITNLTTNTSFGVGNGFDKGKFKYEIEWNTKNEVGLGVGEYHASFDAVADLNGIFFNYLTEEGADFKLRKK